MQIAGDGFDIWHHNLIFHYHGLDALGWGLSVPHGVREEYICSDIWILSRIVLVYQSMKRELKCLIKITMIYNPEAFPKESSLETLLPKIKETICNVRGPWSNKFGKCCDKYVKGDFYF